jgi:hypothetical protein
MLAWGLGGSHTGFTCCGVKSLTLPGICAHSRASPEQTDCDEKRRQPHRKTDLLGWRCDMARGLLIPELQACRSRQPEHA